MEQALHLANLPFAYKHVALMPDAHCGYCMPIGGVLATNGVIIPNAVGKDIDEVIQNESDLVEPVVKLTPLGVIKG